MIPVSLLHTHAYSYGRDHLASEIGVVFVSLSHNLAAEITLHWRSEWFWLHSRPLVRGNLSCTALVPTPHTRAVKINLHRRLGRFLSCIPVRPRSLYFKKSGAEISPNQTLSFPSYFDLS